MRTAHGPAMTLSMSMMTMRSMSRRTRTRDEDPVRPAPEPRRRGHTGPQRNARVSDQPALALAVGASWRWSAAGLPPVGLITITVAVGFLAGLVPGLWAQAVAGTTEVPCVDTPGWENGGDTCATYVAAAYCTVDGTPGSGWDLAWGGIREYASDDGSSALEACCGCGGGRDPAAPACIDTPTGWTSADGEDCAVYRYYAYCSADGSAGSGWDAGWGSVADYLNAEGVMISALGACCVCGGGEFFNPGSTDEAEVATYGTAVPTTSRTTSTPLEAAVAREAVSLTPAAVAAAGSACTDQANWANSYGEACTTYGQYDFCTPDGAPGVGWDISWGPIAEYKDLDGVSALDACCTCGGGEVMPTPTDRSTPVITAPEPEASTTRPLPPSSTLITPMPPRPPTSSPAPPPTTPSASPESNAPINAPTVSPETTAPTGLPASSAPTASPLSQKPSATPTASSTTGPVRPATTTLTPSGAPASSTPTAAPSESPASAVPTTSPTSPPASSTPFAAPSSSAPTAAPSGSPGLVSLTTAPSRPPPTSGPTEPPVASRPFDAPVPAMTTTQPTVSTASPEDEDGLRRAPTEPICTDEPLNWANTYGEDCGMHRYYEYCDADGNPGAGWSRNWGLLNGYTSDKGMTALDACCACGGGSIAVPTTTMSPLRTSIVLPSTTLTASPVGQPTRLSLILGSNNNVCIDLPDWTSTHNNRCRDYEERQYCTADGGHGPGWQPLWGVIDSYPSSNGMSALEACCACGGGRDPTAPICSDGPADWISADGEDCAVYRYFNYCTTEGQAGSGWDSSWGDIRGYGNKHGITAVDACCACGGGQVTNNPICMDLNWASVYNEDCDVYEQHNYCVVDGTAGPGWSPEWGAIGSFLDPIGLSAMEACCVCGGGYYIIPASEAPTLSPVPTPTVPLTPGPTQAPVLTPTVALAACADRPDPSFCPLLSCMATGMDIACPIKCGGCIEPPIASPSPRPTASPSPSLTSPPVQLPTTMLTPPPIFIGWVTPPSHPPTTGAPSRHPVFAPTGQDVMCEACPVYSMLFSLPQGHKLRSTNIHSLVPTFAVSDAGQCASACMRLRNCKAFQVKTNSNPKRCNLLAKPSNEAGLVSTTTGSWLIFDRVVFCGVDCDAEKADAMGFTTEDDSHDNGTIIETGIFTAVVALVTIFSILLVVGRYMSKGGHSRELRVEDAAPGNSKLVSAKSTLGMEWDDADVQANDGIANLRVADILISTGGPRNTQLCEPMDSIFSDASTTSSQYQTHYPAGLRQQRDAARRELNNNDRQE